MFFGANEPTQGLAKFLRKKMTPYEKILWQQLRNKNIFGVKFRRQHPVLFFIADFYCHEVRLVIEVDGPIHLSRERKEWDQNRTGELERFGIKVIRFTNQEIKLNTGQVINKIREEIKDRKIYLGNQ